MPSMLRSLLATSLAVLAACVAPAASAEALDFAALPAGEELAPPARGAAPRWIPATKSVEGLHRVISEFVVRQHTPGFHHYVYFDDPERARNFEAEFRGRNEGAILPSRSCFSTPGNFRIPEEQDGRQLVWDTFSADSFSTQSFPGDPSPKVIPVRVDRWLESDGKVRVESSVFWADSRTGGTRLIARASSELRRVASPYAGVSVYALRTGPDSVSFFVRRELPSEPLVPGGKPQPLLNRLQFAPSRLPVFDPSSFRATVEGEPRVNPCAFERVDLEVAAAGAPAAEAPTAQGKAGGRGVKGASPFRLMRRSPESANVVFAVVLGIEREANTVETGEAASFPVRGGTAATRTAVVNLGLSRPSSEEPLVPSVSYRWLDRTRPLAF